MGIYNKGVYMRITGTRESMDARHKGLVRGLYTSQDRQTHKMADKRVLDRLAGRVLDNSPLSADSDMLPKYIDSEVQSISKCLDYIVTICLVAFISYWIF